MPSPSAETCSYCTAAYFTKCTECKASVCQDCFRPHPVYASDTLCNPTDEREQRHGCYAAYRRTYD